MTYACGSFVFGINLQGFNESYHSLKGLTETISEDIETLVECDVLETEYSGNGDEPTYLGVRFSGIDETAPMGWAEIVALKDRMKAVLEPDSSQRVAFDAALQAVLDNDEISDETKEWFKAQTPEIFLTWGSS